MKKTLKVILWVFGICSALVIVAATVLLFKFKFITFLDQPRFLSDKVETIEATYVFWACDCANWHISNSETHGKEIVAEDCFFIEPASPDLDLPLGFWDEPNTTHLQLTGSFYEDKGIPASYGIENEKPDPAKVFRYTAIRLITGK